MCESKAACRALLIGFLCKQRGGITAASWYIELRSDEGVGKKRLKCQWALSYRLAGLRRRATSVTCSHVYVVEFAKWRRARIPFATAASALPFGNRLRINILTHQDCYLPWLSRGGVVSNRARGWLICSAVGCCLACAGQRSAEHLGLLGSAGF